MDRLDHRTLQALTEALVPLYACTDLRELPHVAIRVINRLLPSELTAYNYFGKEIQTIHNSEVLTPQAIEPFTHFIHEHPSIAYLAATGDESPVKISDFLPDRQWRKTNLYGEFFAPLKLNHQLGLIFEGVGGQIGFSINRSSRDYSEEERLALHLLVPHLKQAFANAVKVSAIRRMSAGFPMLEVDRNHRITFAAQTALELLAAWFEPPALGTHSLPAAVSEWLARATSGTLEIGAPPSPPAVFSGPAGRLTIRLGQTTAVADHFHLLLEEKPLRGDLQNLKRLGLTPRESEILLWVAKGKSNAAIALILGCKVSTVNTHLEHILAKLEVESRTAAVAHAFGVLE